MLLINYLKNEKTKVLNINIDYLFLWIRQMRLRCLKALVVFIISYNSFNFLVFFVNCFISFLKNILIQKNLNRILKVIK
jgi:hypothetical protein